MDTPQTPTDTIPRVRTLAKDFALKGDPTNTPSATPGNKKTAPKEVKPAEVTFADSEKNPIYQAPTWKKRDRPLPPPPSTGNKATPEVKPVPSPTSETTEPGLKPLSRPKTSNEPTIIVDNEDAASATIIRDTKHNRFRLFPAIVDSLKQWWGDFKTKQRTKKIPTYTVPDTTRRKGVIQQATSKTGKVTTFDSTDLQAKIRARRDRALPQKLTPIPSPTTTWTANTEPGFLLLEAPEETVTNIEIVPRKSFRTSTPPAPKPVKPTPPPPPARPVITPVVVSSPPQIIPTPVATPTPRPEPVTVPSEEPAPPATEEYASEEAEETLVTQNRVVEKPQIPVTKLEPANFKEWIFTKSTNLMSLGVAGIIFAVGLVSLIGYAILSNRDSSLEITSTPSLPSLLSSVPIQTIVPTSLTSNSLVAQITENQKQSGFPVQQFVLTTTARGEAALPPATVLAALDIELNSAFSRSITALYFGSIEKTTPFLALKVTDAATALGGMLAWETSLYTDLQSLWAAHQIVSTDTEPASAFTDEVIEGRDVRVLKDQAGTAIITYSISAGNILLITTNESALITLFNLTE